MRISYGIFLSALLIYLYYRDRTMRQKGCDPGANIFARSATSMKKILKAARAAAYAALLLTFVISAASCTSTAGAVPEFDGGVIKLEYNCDGTTEEITVVLGEGSWEERDVTVKFTDPSEAGGAIMKKTGNKFVLILDSGEELPIPNGENAPPFRAARLLSTEGLTLQSTEKKDGEKTLIFSDGTGDVYMIFRGDDRFPDEIIRDSSDGYISVRIKDVSMPGK